MPSLENPQFLRREAENRLKKGAAPPTRGWTSGTEALVLLHRLASSPATAGDALKLLHELQVHQVELDLQHQQMEQNRSELADTLERYIELYEHSPAGQFTVDPQGRVLEANRAGAALFGTKLAELNGSLIDTFLAPRSRSVLAAMLKQLGRLGSGGSCEVRCENGDGTPRHLQVVATASRSGAFYFLAMIEATRRNTAHPA